MKSCWWVGWLKAADVDAKIQLAHVIENASSGEVADIHHHVDDRKGNRALRRG